MLWRDGSGVWRCFADVCPHRLAPLSEGRIEDGHIQCSYHGWIMEGSGKCTRIPQAASESASERACSSERACATTFPTQEANQLLWVWADSSPAAEAESRATPASVIPEIEEPGKMLWLANWFVRDLPYGADVLAENVLDPSHVPWSHHGVIGNRNKVAKLAMEGVKELEAGRGFTVVQSNVPADPESAKRGGFSARNALTWRAPTLAKCARHPCLETETYDGV